MKLKVVTWWIVKRRAGGPRILRGVLAGMASTRNCIGNLCESRTECLKELCRSFGALTKHFQTSNHNFLYIGNLRPEKISQGWPRQRTTHSLSSQTLYETKPEEFRSVSLESVAQYMHKPVLLQGMMEDAVSDSQMFKSLSPPQLPEWPFQNNRSWWKIVA